MGTTQQGWSTVGKDKAPGKPVALFVYHRLHTERRSKINPNTFLGAVLGGTGSKQLPKAHTWRGDNQ